MYTQPPNAHLLWALWSLLNDFWGIFKGQSGAAGECTMKPIEADSAPQRPEVYEGSKPAEAPLFYARYGARWNTCMERASSPKGC